jgi:hypothetical protein
VSKRALIGITGVLGCAVIAAAVASVTTFGHHPARTHRNLHGATSLTTIFAGRSNEASREAGKDAGGDSPGSLAQENYDNQAYPATAIAPAQVSVSESAYKHDKEHGDKHSDGWKQVGPKSPFVPGLVSNAGTADTFQSGRLTAIALSPKCGKRGEDDECQIYIGAAGGGIWTAENALSKHPRWHESSQGLTSNAIGSIAFDPTDRSGRTLYVGTGEPNGSSDSEAGVGLFRSTNSGRSWSLVPGSVAVASGRSIGAIAVDPKNADHIFIGTDVARHGSSSSNGGRFTPPAAPQVGLYESFNGGASFTLAFSQPSDSVLPVTANGGDFFRGGVSNVQFDPLKPGRIWLSIFDYGLYRTKTGGGYEQAFASPSAGDPDETIVARTEFAFAPMGSKLHIYLGDSSSAYDLGSQLYRTDDAEVASPVFTPLPAGDGYCGDQCSYDMPVGSPAGSPNEVWVGGQMQYGEIGNISNGRAVQRSTDGGATFTDMTLDANGVAQHPDQHAMAFAPGRPGVAFLGSDGGIVRTGGSFADTSSDCAARGLTGDDLAACQGWLSATPTEIVSMNDGLPTLQFQSLSVNPNDPKDLLGGTQDNGTWSFMGSPNSWFESIGGDGGQSGTDVSGNTRMHTYFGAQTDVNFHGVDTLGWDWTGDVLGTEAASFYIPLINDPKVSGTWFLGQQRVWRTQDNGGPEPYLQQFCNEYTGDYDPTLTLHPCGDWVGLGSFTLTGSHFGPSTDKSGSYVVATERAASDTHTLWAGTRRGRIFISQNADAAAAAVTFTRIDTAAQPTRFPSGIAVDPTNKYHAYISYSGYDAYATAASTALGHVFEVTYSPITHAATWTDLSYDLGDQPITDVAYDNVSGNLYASTDFGVLQLKTGATSWAQAAPDLPMGAVYGLTIVPSARILYAATHGRGAWRLDLSGDKHNDHH